MPTECLNLSSPFVKEALTIVKSKPVLAKILSNLNANPTLEDVRDAYGRMPFVQPLDEGVYYQLEDEDYVNPMIRERVLEAADRMGIEVTDLASYARSTGLDVTNVAAVADTMAGIIAIAEGQEAALTEEMVHIATQILE